MTNTEQNILKEIESWEKVHYEKEELNDNRDLQLTKLYSKLDGYQLAQKEKGLIKKEDVLKIANRLYAKFYEDDVEVYFEELKAELEKL